MRWFRDGRGVLSKNGASSSKRNRKPGRVGEDSRAQGKHYSEELNIGILKELESSKAVPSICHEHGMMEATVYRWQTRHGGIDALESRRLNELEDENRRLKALVADLALQIQLLKEFNSREW